MALGRRNVARRPALTASLRRSLATLHAADLAAYRRGTERPAPRVDRVLYPLSRAADHSKIWIALAVMLASRGGRANRRAALRGVLSVAATSVLTNAVMKPMTSRVRPTPAPDGWMTRVARVPSSTSFPSGHAASAGAFAVGASLEMPQLAGPLGLAAAAVGWSRVRTRVHYPGDVVAGLVVGAAVAVATTRWWPRRPAAPASVRPVRARVAGAATDGAGLTIVVNPSAGSAHRGDLTTSLREALPAATISVLDEGADLTEALTRAGMRGAIGIVGGDGSINAAAGVALAASHPSRTHGRIRVSQRRRRPMISVPAKILATADAYQAMTQPRPHRAALRAAEAGQELRTEADRGRLDPAATDAVLAAAGQKPSRSRAGGPAGLTSREAQVLGLLPEDSPTRASHGNSESAQRSSATTSNTSTTSSRCRAGPVPPCMPRSWGSSTRLLARCERTREGAAKRLARSPAGRTSHGMARSHEHRQSTAHQPSTMSRPFRPRASTRRFRRYAGAHREEPRGRGRVSGLDGHLGRPPLADGGGRPFAIEGSLVGLEEDRRGLGLGVVAAGGLLLCGEPGAGLHQQLLRVGRLRILRRRRIRRMPGRGAHDDITVTRARASSSFVMDDERSMPAACASRASSPFEEAAASAAGGIGMPRLWRRSRNGFASS